MELANEIWLNVFEYLDARTLNICGTVSWQWKELSEQHSLWERHFTKDFPLYGYYRVKSLISVMVILQGRRL
jgi:hypothetical protein